MKVLQSSCKLLTVAWGLFYADIGGCSAFKLGMAAAAADEFKFIIAIHFRRLWVAYKDNQQNV